MSEEVNRDSFRTIEEILQMNQRNVNKLRRELDAEVDSIETIDGHENAMKADMVNTEQKKHDFIKEIKSGLIHDIKRNQGIKTITPKESPINKFFRGLFTKF